MVNDLLSSSAIPPVSFANAELGGEVHQFFWNWENQQITVVYEVLGQGTPILLLPAFSTVSMRQEMSGIGKLLAPYFQVVALDFPGFGSSSRPRVNYGASLYQHFLENFVTSIFNTPIGVVAAGHSAAYVLQLAQKHSSVFSRISLVAPTWRGPLPTMGASRQVAGIVRELVRSPIIGQALYKLNTLPSFLSFMYRRHVYVDQGKLTPSFINYKWHNTQKPGARFAPAAFVTGTLDAVHSQAEFLALGRDLSVPLMVVMGESSPPKSLANMKALAALPGVSSASLPGSLGMHEEFPEAIVEKILPFFQTSAV
ncbi:MAG: alpha/beta hydrolase [Calothrix sp. MO_192.B10]|nr:alpha/beta hydrolase [Calothrix sp. MO_192.B10]